MLEIGSVQVKFHFKVRDGVAPCFDFNIEWWHHPEDESIRMCWFIAAHALRLFGSRSSAEIGEIMRAALKQQLEPFAKNLKITVGEEGEVNQDEIRAEFESTVLENKVTVICERTCELAQGFVDAVSRALEYGSVC